MAIEMKFPFFDLLVFYFYLFIIRLVTKFRLPNYDQNFDQSTTNLGH